MNRAIIMIIALAFIIPATADAGGKSSFWSSLRSRVQGISPKKQAVVTTAVGGVRGAASEEGDSVYWKGKEVNEVDEVELQKFNNAIDLAVEGDNAESLKAFGEFLNEYPDSTLRVEALKAVSALSSEGVGQESAQPETQEAVSDEGDAPAQPNVDAQVQSDDQGAEAESPAVSEEAVPSTGDVEKSEPAK